MRAHIFVVLSDYKLHLKPDNHIDDTFQFPPIQPHVTGSGVLKQRNLVSA